MPTRLRQIVYISRASALWCDDELGLISDVSQVLNARSKVTGLLLFDGQGFIQAIEGPRAALKETMARILADRRHHSLQIAVDREVPRRQFGSWNMQCRKTPAGACSVPFIRKIKEVVEGVDDAFLQALFIGFALVGSTTRRQTETAVP